MSIQSSPFFLAATAAVGVTVVGVGLVSCMRLYNSSCFYHRHRKSTIVITGASSGVGASLAKLLAKELPESRLVLLARTHSLLLQLKEDIELTCRAGRCEVYPIDCSKGVEVEGVSYKVGRADILVCAAGAGSFRAIWERDAGEEETARCLAAPLVATLNICHAFLPPMLDSREGGGDTGGAVPCLPHPLAGGHGLHGCPVGPSGCVCSPAPRPGREGCAGV
jgi:NAD(P)-dependent dehydrogenase (short-subunit alcohol dehydrogenase family)